jgi:L-xylulokinase
MGTWNINIALSDMPVRPHKFRQCTIYADDRLYACIDSSATSASNLEWILKNIFHEQIGYDTFETIISGYKADELSLYFMPFIYGGLVPGNPGAAFVGLRSEHTHADMLRAVAEGVAFAHAYHIQNLKREGLKGDEVLLTGGASRNAAWCQLMADILQMPVLVPQASETGALGACLVAGVGAGCFADIDEGVKRMVKIEATFHPQSATASIYQRKFQRFLEILDWMSR